MSAPHEDDGLVEAGAALRERFHQAVSGLEAAPGTLDYLRRAVPARRRRRRAALAVTAVSVFAVSAGATLAAQGSFEDPSTRAGGTTVGNVMTTSTSGVPGDGSAHGPGTPSGQDMSPGRSGVTQAPSSQASTTPTSLPSPSQASTSVQPTGGEPVPACQDSSITALSAAQSSVSGGVTYETFEGTARSVCTLAGRPALTVFGPDGAPAQIAVNAADQSAAPLLPAVAEGQTLVLEPGDRFEFQLAWVPTACAPDPTPTSAPSSGPVTPSSPTASASASDPTPSGPTSSPSGQPTPSGTPSSSAPASTEYSVAYSLDGSQPSQSVTLDADCGAAIYVTDYFQASGRRHVGLPPTDGTMPTR